MKTLTALWKKLPRCWVYSTRRWKNSCYIERQVHYVWLFGRKWDIFEYCNGKLRE